MVEVLVNYWWMILILVAIVSVATVAIIRFVKKPNGEQLLKVREWLLYAVSIAEDELGSGTGKLKLRMVYDMFLTKFPFLAKTIPFAVFSYLVDEALDEFKEMVAGDDFTLSYDEEDNEE